MIESPLKTVGVPVRSGALKTIELSTKGNNTFFITELTLEQKDAIIEAKKLGTLDEVARVFGIDCESIVLIGSSEKINTANVGRYVGYLLGPRQGNVGIRETHIDNREVHYREYSFTPEQQENSVHLINHCPDKRMSVNSIKRVIKSDYCCIWKRESQS